MYKLFNHKKGIAIDDVLPLVFTIVVFVFIMLLMSINNINQKKEMITDIKVRLGSIEGEQELFNILITEIEIDKKNITVSDLIAAYYMEYDDIKKERYRIQIEDIVIERLNELEYTYITKEYSIKTIRGFMIFLTDDPNENFGGTAIKKDRKFMSENAQENFPREIVPWEIPLPIGEKIYVVWIETSKRI